MRHVYVEHKYMLNVLPPIGQKNDDMVMYTMYNYFHLQ